MPLWSLHLTCISISCDIHMHECIVWYMLPSIQNTIASFIKKILDISSSFKCVINMSMAKTVISTLDQFLNVLLSGRIRNIISTSGSALSSTFRLAKQQLTRQLVMLVSHARAGKWCQFTSTFVWTARKNCAFDTPVNKMTY